MLAQQRDRLITLAQGILRDERHWSLVDSADRAEDGRALAEMLLAALDVDPEPCPINCGRCKAHRANCGEDEGDGDLRYERVELDDE